MRKPADRGLTAGIALGLVALTLAAFWGVSQLGFVNFDDHLYIDDNPSLHLGLSPAGLRWAFTTPGFYNWIPLTLITYLADYQIGGMQPLTYHVTNLVFHVLNVLLLFWVMRRWTGAPWCSAWVAALFAVHPLHVESVAWVAERKDVVSAFFWFLTMLAYLRYRERPGIARYLAVCLSFTAGLLAKPMLVTLPCVLLLLDYWPLGRFGDEETSWRARVTRAWPALAEKLPLFALTVLIAVITYYFQAHSGTRSAVGDYALAVRLANAALAYAVYLGKMCWPMYLAAFYPHPWDVPPSPGLSVAAAVVMLGALTTWVVSARKRHPYLMVGWLWYLGTLVPVIGFVQVGEQGMADRYTYIPLIGIFIALVWGIRSAVTNRKWARRVTVVVACGLLAACLVLTGRQVDVWRDSFTLWRHAVNVTAFNGRAHYNLGCALLDADQIPEAQSQFRAALEVAPRNAQAANNLGLTFMKQGRRQAAAEAFDKAIRLEPGLAEAHVNLGNLCLEQGDLQAAMDCFAKTLAIDPGNVDAHIEMGHALTLLKQDPEAARQFDAALQLEPQKADVHYRIGSILLGAGETQAAIERIREAVRLEPDLVKAQIDLGVALASQGRFDEAIVHLDRARSLEPDNPDALYNLGGALAASGRLAEAREQFTRLLALHPGDQAARQALQSLGP